MQKPANIVCAALLFCLVGCAKPAQPSIGSVVLDSWSDPAYPDASASSATDKVFLLDNVAMKDVRLTNLRLDLYRTAADAPGPAHYGIETTFSVQSINSRSPAAGASLGVELYGRTGTEDTLLGRFWFDGFNGPDLIYWDCKTMPTDPGSQHKMIIDHYDFSQFDDIESIRLVIPQRDRQPC